MKFTAKEKIEELEKRIEELEKRQVIYAPIIINPPAYTPPSIGVRCHYHDGIRCYQNPCYWA